MKYINKEKEPPHFLKWKAKDKMYQRNKPNWNRLPADLKRDIKQSILSEQGYICCYCERSIDEEDCHLEHIKPRKKHPQYQLDYDNLSCSCQFELEKGEPRHCGNSKGSWYDANSFVSPLDQNCEGRFTYTFDGCIYAISGDKAAEVTIVKLKLNIDKLNSFRKAAIEPFLEESLTEYDIKLFVEEYLKDKKYNDGVFNPFFTAIKYLFNDYIKA